MGNALIGWGLRVVNSRSSSLGLSWADASRTDNFDFCGNTLRTMSAAGRQPEVRGEVSSDSAPAVRDQLGLHLHGDADLLVTDDPPPSLSRRPRWALGASLNDGSGGNGRRKAQSSALDPR